MGIAHRSPRLLRGVTIAGFTVASQMSLGLGLGSANADETTPNFTASNSAYDGAMTGPTAAGSRMAGIEVGLGALALMKRERSEQRRVPKMLPLLATRTEHGQVWFGLARDRREGRRSTDVRLDLCWTIPIGR
jgi:hypothetical protein